MLHRNVIFRGTDVTPHAISSNDVINQADFFAQLDAACQEPCEVLTIPHNTNFSWGKAFSRTDEDGYTYTAADIERRARIDRLFEITFAERVLSFDNAAALHFAEFAADLRRKGKSPG